MFCSPGQGVKPTKELGCFPILHIGDGVEGIPGNPMADRLASLPAITSLFHHKTTDICSAFEERNHTPTLPQLPGPTLLRS